MLTMFYEQTNKQILFGCRIMVGSSRWRMIYVYEKERVRLPLATVFETGIFTCFFQILPTRKSAQTYTPSPRGAGPEGTTFHPLRS